MYKRGAVEEIIEIAKSDFHEQNKDALLEARDLILNKYNLWATTEAAIKGTLKLPE
jgi:hypothetical protein